MTSTSNDRSFAKELNDQLVDAFDDDIETLKDDLAESADKLFDKLKSVMLKTSSEFVIEWVKDHLTPAEVFPDSELEEWAMANGWVKA